MLHYKPTGAGFFSLRVRAPVWDEAECVYRQLLLAPVFLVCLKSGAEKAKRVRVNAHMRHGSAGRAGVNCQVNVWPVESPPRGVQNARVNI